MTIGPPNLRTLHMAGDRLALRARAAEQLINATDATQAVRQLFDLIAPELRLNLVLLCDVSEKGRLQLVAHRGIAKAQAVTVASQLCAAAGSEPLTVHMPDIQRSDDPRMDDLKRVGLTDYYAVPLQAGGRPASMLGFGRRWTERFNEEDQAFLRAVSAYLAAALERLRSEARRHEGEERLRLAMETAGFGTFDYDVTSGERTFSPEMRAICGFGPHEEFTLGTLIRMCHADDLPLLSAKLAAASGVSQSGEVAEFSNEHRIVRRDGTQRWLTVKARTIFREQDGERRPSRYVGIVQDITDRKVAEERIRASEERLQKAQELGEVASWDWDFSGEHIWVSEGFCELHGLPPGTPVNLGTIEQLVHPNDRERVMREGRNDARLDYKIEYRIIRPSDQQVRWIQAKGGIVRDPSGADRLVGISIDITERMRDQERERLLTREVDHRAKNLLNVIQSVVHLTRADSMSAFVDEITGRIHALARVHSFIAASRWEGAELSRLVEAELAPFAEDGDRLSLHGPLVDLKPAAAQSMALVIHELTINAAKYGALSEPAGQVEVGWTLSDAAEPDLILRWQERGGPATQPPRELGFGTTVILASVERQLGGSLEMAWEGTGLRCEMTLPARQLVRTTAGEQPLI